MLTNSLPKYIVKKTWNGYVVLNLATGVAQSLWADSRAALAVARDLNRKA